MAAASIAAASVSPVATKPSSMSPPVEEPTLLLMSSTMSSVATSTPANTCQG
jgi:hypothetical protein